MSAIDPNVTYSGPTVGAEDSKWYEAEFLEPNNELTWDLLDLVHADKVEDMSRFYTDLLNKPEALGRTSFRFKRSGINGTVTSYKEELRLSEIDNATSTNSLSMSRKFTSKSDQLKGKTSFLPFQPGGLVGATKAPQSKDETAFLHRDENGLFDIPEGFTRGLSVKAAEAKNDDIHRLENMGNEELEDLPTPSNGIDEKQNADPVLSNISLENEDSKFDPNDIDGLVPMDYSLIRHRLEEEKEMRKDWAHVVDLAHKVEDFDEVVPNMARKWPFELDTFQQEAVYHLEQGDSVFVAAHTSAGKTVVAEYAIAMANRNMTKAIYTSPIKALSNQKFRDFKETFKEIDVGLITGDVQINPEANCLIMTTEILRSMLYRGADLIRDVEFVIFDEVHYVNDIDRGVVWEEVIIMLPDHVKYVLLSATVPNTFEFANWVGRTKQKDIYVISTPKRPVPLEIFIWAKKDLFKVIDAQRKFAEIEFKKHVDALESSRKGGAPPKVNMGAGSRGGRGGTARGGNRMANRGGRGNFTRGPGAMRDGPNKNTWTNLVQYLKGNNLLPTVIFVFSKKKCEEYADTISSVDFCTAKEKSEIHMFIDRAISRLKKEDRELPQILKIREMLSRGIAVHHGGLLPIVKECIEILFAKTLVKVLFATETFAMGLNLPTRTVVFNNTRKHDGTGFRNLLPGEFTQMSGRAGRRGLDPTGTVIVMSYNQPLSMGDFKEVTLGTPTKLVSQFRLTYNMILNLIRIEAMKVEEMIKFSFSENSTQTLLPEHQRTVETLTDKLKDLTIDDCQHCNLEDMSQVYDMLKEYEQIYGDIMEDIQRAPFLKNLYLKVGRLVCYRNPDGCLRVGFVIRTEYATKSLVLLTFDHGSYYDSHSMTFKLPYIPNKPYLINNLAKINLNGNLRVEICKWDDVTFVSRYVLKDNMKDILQNKPEAVKKAKETINLCLKFQSKWEPAAFPKATRLSLHDLIEKQKEIVNYLPHSKSLACNDFKKHFKQFDDNKTVKKEIESLQRLISDENLELLPDYEQRLAVLETLNFIDDNHNVLLKGRVACEINSGWELIITELVLDNFLGDFEPEEIVALLSCFVYEGRTNEEEEPAITPRLEKGKAKILEIMEQLLQVFIGHKLMLTSEEEEFTTRKRFALMNVVYEWARGMTFNEIMAMSVEAEGTIVRVITRLDEICREVKNAALIIGDSTLHSKMSEAQEKIKRDIVFCGSLYL